MAIDDSPDGFRYLVKLYLWSTIFIIGSIALEFFVGPWLEFSDQFDALTGARFKPMISEDAWMMVCLIAVVAHYVGAFGLLRFKRWARSVFLWPLLIFLVADIVLYGLPSYSTALMTFIFFLDAALFGAIVLLSYSASHGTIWFAPTINAGEE